MAMFKHNFGNSICGVISISNTKIFGEFFANLKRQSMKLCHFYTLISLVLGSVLSLISNVALADHSDPFIQVICNPDLDYFSLRSFRIWDTDIWNSHADSKIRADEIRKNIQKDGVYYLDDFMKAGYTCKLPTRKISFNLVNGPGGGHCYQDDAGVDIKINGKIVHNFELFGGKCASYTHQIEIDQFSLVDCSRQEYDSTPALHETMEIECSEVKLP